MLLCKSILENICCTCCRYLIGCLNSAGYLDCPLAELAEELGVPLFDMEQALLAIQTLDPPGVGARVLALAETGPVAVVFGREDKGLLNEEIAQCTHLVRIPVDEGYTSINLSQAVLITCYELFTASGRYQPPHEKAPPAPQGQKMQLMKMWREMLEDIGYMDEQKADHMMQGIHRVFSRGVVTKDDAALLLGVARQAVWAHRHPLLDGGRKTSSEFSS